MVPHLACLAKRVGERMMANVMNMCVLIDLLISLSSTWHRNNAVSEGLASGNFAELYNFCEEEEYNVNRTDACMAVQFCPPALRSCFPRSCRIHRDLLVGVLLGEKNNCNSLHLEAYARRYSRR
jgi:hypothetical protein